MTNPCLRTPFGDVELRPVRSEPGTDMRVYLLLPNLDELVGVPWFGLANPIRLPARPRGIVLQ